MDTSSGADSGSSGSIPPSGDGIGPWGYAPVALDIAADEVVIDDFDGDGHVDVFAQGAAGGETPVQLHLGTGAGISGVAFEPAAAHSIAWGAMPLAGDFDGVLGLDVASFRSHEATYAALDDGASAFTASFVSPDDDSFPEFGVAVLDVDGDGLDDLFVPQGHSSGLTVYRSDGAGGFAAGDNLAGPACYVSATAVVDLDDDGFDDVVATGSCNSIPEALPLVVYDGGGDGLVAGQSYFEGPGVLEGGDLVAVDLDGDGDRDVITGAYPNGLAVLTNEDGVLAPPEGHPLAWDSLAMTIVPMQLESDAAIAFVVQDHDGLAAVVEPSDAEAWVTTPIELGGTVVGGADFDGDGRTDLVVLVDGELTVWFSAL